MTILLLETATSVCSVVLEKDGALLAERHSDEQNAHSSKLAVFIDEIFSQTGLTPNDLDAVCVSSGPGSYTGLRIGVSTAKGLCYGLGKPLLAVPTLESMAAQYFAAHPDYNGLVCPMIDARRMECYAAFYARGTESLLQEVRSVAADIVEEGIYDNYLDAHEVVFVGDGAEKTRSKLGMHPNARYSSDFCISAQGMIQLAEQRLRQQKTEDVAYFEPFYLKDFVAKKSVVRGLKSVNSEQ